MDVLKTLCLFILIQVIRGIVILVHFPVLRMVGYKIRWKEALVLTLGASKGAINIILSLIIISHDELD